MSIPTLAQITAQIGNREVNHVESLITARLETEGTVALLNDPKVTDKTLKYSFDGVFLSDRQIALLIESLKASKWESPVVKNGKAPPFTGIGNQPRPHNINASLSVEFKAPAVAAPVVPGTGD